MIVSQTIVVAHLTAADDRSADFVLVAAVLAGDNDAGVRLLDIAAAALWAVVGKLEGDGPHRDGAFTDVVAAVKADGFARLRGFDGRSRLQTFLALMAREILAERLARSFVEDPSGAWSRFERYFGSDIQRRIGQRFPRDGGTQDDIYKDVCVKLVEDDFRRIRAYSGRGSFTGYVLTTVDRLLIDLLRRNTSRRRLPAAVARLCLLDQEVYAAIVWDNCPADPARLAVTLRDRLEQEPSPAEIQEAVVRTSAIVHPGPMGTTGRDAASIDTLASGAEEIVITDQAAPKGAGLLLAEEEHIRLILTDAARVEAADLAQEDQLYLQIAFSAADPLPTRQIAQMMGCPVETVYRLKQRAHRWLTAVAARLGKTESCSSHLEKSLRDVIERLLREPERAPTTTADLRARLAADFADALDTSSASRPDQHVDYMAAIATHLDGRLTAPARDAFVQALAHDSELRADLAAAAALLDAISDELDPLPAAFRASALTTLPPPHLVAESSKPRGRFAGFDRRRAIGASLAAIAAIMVLLPFILPRDAEWPSPSDAFPFLTRSPPDLAFPEEATNSNPTAALSSSAPAPEGPAVKPTGADLSSNGWVAAPAQEIGPVATLPQAAPVAEALPCEDYRPGQERLHGQSLHAKRPKATRDKTDGRSNDLAKSPCAPAPQSEGSSGLADGTAQHVKPHIK